MRRALGAVIILFVSGASAFADDPNSLALSPDVARCISENAPKVEGAIANLNDAVEFLVGDICAGPVQEQVSSEQHAAMRKFYEAEKKKCAEKKAASTSPKLSDLDEQVDPCAMADTESETNMSGFTVFAGEQKPADARMLAARLLLDLRLQHSKSGQSH